jgi:integrase
MDRVRAAIRTRHYSPPTEEAYTYWTRRFIVFHGRVHPSTIGAPEIGAFLTWLATEQHVSASTQNQALSALLFLYRDVLHVEIGEIDRVLRAQAPRRLPVVLTREEVACVLKHLTGVQWIIGMLLYGAGLRLEECVSLRVKDVDFDRRELMVRRGKRQKDRRTMLPLAVGDRLRAHLETVKAQHQRDLAAALGRVVFRYHLHESAVQRAVATAVRKAGLTKPAGPHTFRHYAASRTMPRHGGRIRPEPRDHVAPE